MPEKKILQPTGEPFLDVCLDTLAQGKQALVFVATKSSAEKAAEDLAKKIKIRETPAVELAEKVGSVLSKPTKQCLREKKCIESGVAFHHAGLRSEQKQLIENGFRSGVVRIICCTPTLAYGLDLPAFRSIIRDVKRFGAHGSVYIPVLEYLQMAGRAGRPKIDSHGEAILVAKSEAEVEDLIDRYIKGVPEDIYSKLAVEPVLRSALLSLIATNFCRSRADLQKFFAQTFWAHQFQDLSRLYAIIDRVLNSLEEWKFITAPAKEDFVSADQISGSDTFYRATPLGVRVSQVYIDPYTAHGFITALDRAKSAPPFYAWSLLISFTLEMRPLLQVSRKEWEQIMHKLTAAHVNALVKEPHVYEPEFDDYLNAGKTAMLLEAWAEEADEEYLLEQFNTRPGELKAKLDTADWLLYALAELSQVAGHREIVKEIRKVRMRLKYGAKEELLPLLQLEGVGRIRARKLYNNNLKGVAELSRVDITTLEQLLGPVLARSIKKQVGQPEQEPVPEGKRKGQLGLGKFEGA